MLGVVGQQYIVRLHGALYEETWYCTEHVPLNAAQVVNFCLKFYNEVKDQQTNKIKNRKKNLSLWCISFSSRSGLPFTISFASG